MTLGIYPNAPPERGRVGAEVLPSATPVCESCGSTGLAPFEVPGGANLLRCPQCDLYQQGRAANADEYDLSYHERNAYAARRAHKVRTAAVRLNRVAYLLDTARPRFLDIGCSLGATVEAAVARGWDAHGVDVSAEVVEWCRARGLNCRLIEAAALPYHDAEFDVLTAWHVIEHVGNVAETLAEWSRVLKPGGVLALETPDASCLKVRLRGARYRRFWTPEHVYAFNRRNLTPLLESAGFALVAPPAFGRLRELPLALAAFAVAHRLHDGLMQLTGLSKAFEVFCRRRVDAADSVPRRRAA